MPGAYMLPKSYAAKLVAPDGAETVYIVHAKNKTEARLKVRRLYRRDTPAPSNGFYSFEQQKLTWLSNEDAL